MSEINKDRHNNNKDNKLKKQYGFFLVAVTSLEITF